VLNLAIQQDATLFTRDFFFCCCVALEISGQSVSLSISSGLSRGPYYCLHGVGLAFLRQTSVSVMTFMPRSD